MPEACLPILVELAPTGRKSGIMAWQTALENVSGVVVASIIGVPWITNTASEDLEMAKYAIIY